MLRPFFIQEWELFTHAKPPQQPPGGQVQCTERQTRIAGSIPLCPGPSDPKQCGNPSVNEAESAHIAPQSVGLYRHQPKQEIHGEVGSHTLTDKNQPRDCQIRPPQFDACCYSFRSAQTPVGGANSNIYHFWADTAGDEQDLWNILPMRPEIA